MSGDLIKLDVFIENAIEPEIMLFVLLGQEYDPVKGDAVLVFPFESDEGEFAAIPGSFKPSSSTAARASLEPDWNALNTRITALENGGNSNVTLFGTHLHTGGILPGGLTGPPQTPQTPTATSATFAGSDRLRVTHD